MHIHSYNLRQWLGEKSQQSTEKSDIQAERLKPHCKSFLLTPYSGNNFPSLPSFDLQISATWIQLIKEVINRGCMMGTRYRLRKTTQN